jgi:hypothetical protein
MSSVTWGDEVVVSDAAPSKFKPGSRAWVVGLGTSERNLVTIEYEDGSSAEIPPELLLLSQDGKE